MRVHYNLQDYHAGNIIISAHNLLLSQSEIFNSGMTAGYVDINVADTFISNIGYITSEGHMADDATNNITINAGRAVMMTTSWISASSFYTGGNIMITTPNLMLDNSLIAALALSGNGGNIFINADHTLLDNSGIKAASFGGGDTEGGNITVNGDTLVILRDEDSRMAFFGYIGLVASATEGKGGNILVNTDVFLHNAPSVNDVLNASSEVSGNDGTVKIQTSLDVANTVGVGSRPSDLRDAAQDPCARRKGIKKSTLTKVGRGGYPADNHPIGMTVSLSGRGESSPEPVKPVATEGEPLALNSDRDDCRL